MAKVSIKEIEQALTLIKKSSTDVHILVREDADQIRFQFSTVDGQISTIKLYDESTRSFAKVETTENLGQVLNRLKQGSQS